MSSRQRKRPGGAVDSGPAQKRSRLLPSGAAATSHTRPRDLEPSGTAALEPEIIDLTGEDVIDLTGKSSEPEVIIISDDESAVDREQSQQQPPVSSDSENSAEPLAREDEEDLSIFDDDWLRYNFDRPYWSDEDSEDREQSQQQPPVSSDSENSAEPLAREDEEDLSDFDDSVLSSPWPAGPGSPASSDDDHSEDWEPPNSFRRAENSAERAARHVDEELRDYQGAQPAGPASPPPSKAEDSEDREQSQQQPPVSSDSENSAEPLAREDEEDLSIFDGNWLRNHFIFSHTAYADSELPAVCGRERRNVPLNNQEQVDGSGNPTGANDAPVAGPAPAGQGSEEEDTADSDAQQGVVIRCPICWNFYSEIMHCGRQLVATTCGHVFCSGCLPNALETTYVCPTCREYLWPDEYHPIYL